MAQKNEIPALNIKSPVAVTENVEHYRQPFEKDIIILAELGGGAIRFAAAAFPGASLDQIYAQYNAREPEGRGPHFDIYNENIDEGHPWLGVYNLAGACAVRAAVMPSALSEQYAELYPKADKAAYEARRHFGALVLESTATQIYTGTLQAGTGLILPEQKDGPNIVHEVVPEDSSNPGAFIKMVVPKNEEAILKDIREQDFEPLDELLTHNLDDEPTEYDISGLPDMSSLPLTPPKPRSSHGRRSRPRRRSGSSSASDGPTLYD